MTLIDSGVPPSRSFLTDSSCFEHGFLRPIDKLYRFTPPPVLFDSRPGFRNLRGLILAHPAALVVYFFQAFEPMEHGATVEFLSCISAIR
jgi:hypothetical protein